VVSFPPQPLYPTERSSDAHCEGGWVSPKAALAAVTKKNPIIATAGN